LGITVIPVGNTFFIATPNASNIAGYHDLFFMIGSGNHVIDLEHLVEQGEMGKFAQRLSAELMKLNSEDLEDCALSIMSLFESFMGDTYDSGTGDVSFASLENFAGFISVGIPIIIKTAIGTPEGRALIWKFVSEMVSGIASRKNGKLMLVALAAIALRVAPAILTAGAVIGAGIWGIATTFDTAYDFMNGLLTGDLEIDSVLKLLAIGATIAGTAGLGFPIVIPVILSIVAVIGFVAAIIDNWDTITAMFTAGIKWLTGLAITVISYVEKMKNAIETVFKKAIARVAQWAHDTGRKIVDFGKRVMKSIESFCAQVMQTAARIFRGIFEWTRTLFGTATSTLGRVKEIVVIAARIDDLQKRLAVLRRCYLDTKQATQGTRSVVRHVSSHYHESYVRNCCMRIETGLRSAERYIEATEHDLERRRRMLVNAIESYQNADNKAGRKFKLLSI
jgi:hypothetical protein